MESFATLLYRTCLLIAIAFTANGLNGGDVAMVIICQGNVVSQEKCHQTEAGIGEDGGQDASPRVILTSRDVHHDGDWTIFPLISILSEKLEEVPAWIVFCTEHTALDLTELLQVLDKQSPDTDVFLGYALTDPEPTIIHHFSSNTQFRFPLLPAGFVLSRALFKKIADKMAANLSYKTADFSIDASYEFASFASDVGVELEHSNHFCVDRSSGCATHVTIASTSDSKQNSAVDLEKIYFAVKTCKKFHADRVPIVKSTWGSSAKHIAYYSDAYDETIPTVVLNVSNVLHGHCSKTRGIIRALRAKFKKKPDLQWAAITDDDTILSVTRLAQLLQRYNSSEALAIGERYGYNLQQSGGYNYLTGGGGVVLSRAALLQFHRRACFCPSPTSPDDMFLFGVCAKRLGIALVHTPLIHQARPNDYSSGYLSIGPPISFHKHWMVDPTLVYHQWLTDHGSTSHSSLHQEL